MQLDGLFCSIFGSAVPLAMFCYPFQKPFRPESVEMIIHFLLISLFLSTISDHLEVPLHSDMQLHVHLLPLHLGSCLSRLWPAHHSARGHGKVFSRGKWVGNQAISRKKNLSQVDLPNIETGSPHMSGTVRDKIFVGQVSRKRNARECQEWCQVGATFKFQKKAKPDLNRDLFKAGQLTVLFSN